MSSANESEGPKPPSPKSPKLEEPPSSEEEDDSDDDECSEEEVDSDDDECSEEEFDSDDDECSEEEFDSDDDEWDNLSEDLRLFDEEWGDGFDVDFTKLRHTFGAGAADLDSSTLVAEPDTNRALLNRLSEMAISYYKENMGTSLEFVQVSRANYHPSAAVTIYMTFEANDPSDGNQKKSFQTVTRYLPGDTEVCSCRPKPC
ncbi:uncharacterized protein LOC112088928 [Eutrema salsugineum]|uniref:uncharacterized protein LOC112088928 n=1 Tax=Eutrema salsugineum TaxID=72664 RepID=UPI000CED6988|nr:uncharacterized protein LOC112088928 [Eutrema salsugineum]